jgi:predicted GIY-YIG superfamily endonuclease
MTRARRSKTTLSQDFMEYSRFFWKHRRATLAIVLFMVVWVRWGFAYTVLLWLLVEANLWVWVWGSRWLREAKASGQPPSLWLAFKVSRLEKRRRKYLAKQWASACASLGITRGQTVPNLTNVRATAAGDLVAYTAAGRLKPGAIDELAKHSDALAGSIGCKEATVRPTAPGCAEVTFYWSDPLSRVLPLPGLPMPKEGQIAFGVLRDGSPATIQQDLSTLIGGSTGSGKSGVIWAMLADLVRRKVPVRLYVSDPKGGIELQALGRHVGEKLGSLEVREYVTTPADTIKMVERVEGALTKRQRVQQSRKLTKPTEENPLVVVLLDELLVLSLMLKKGTDSPLGRILFTGRASLYVVWANTQLGHASELGSVRNLFAQRIAFRTSTAETTDTILGNQATVRGARCHLLDKQSDRGVGFAAAEDDSLQKFRAALVTDAEMKQVASGVVPAGMVLDAPVRFKKCAVYRLYNARRELLYVGISQRPRKRMVEHAADKTWWGEVDPAATEVVWLVDVRAARVEERRAIRDELPKYNVTHQVRWNPLRRRPRPVVVEGEVVDAA